VYLTLPRKHHSLQEFKRLAKQAKVNETRIIVRKLKSLRSSSDRPGTAKHDPATVVRDLEAQLDALKVHFVCSKGNLIFNPLQVLNLTHFATAALIQKLKHNRALSGDKTVSEFLSTELQSSLPLTYYSVQPNTAEGKIRNRLASCKSFSGRALEIVTDLQAVLDPSAAKPSSLTARHSTIVDEGDEFSEGQTEDGEGEDDFFDQAEFSDDKVNDNADGWESGSVHSEDEGLPIGLLTTPANSDPDSKSESGSGSDDDGSTPDSDPDTPLPVKKGLKAFKRSGNFDFLTFSFGWLYPRNRRFGSGR
jgi:hypothetical protein